MHVSFGICAFWAKEPRPHRFFLLFWLLSLFRKKTKNSIVKNWNLLLKIFCCSAKRWGATPSDAVPENSQESTCARVPVIIKLHCFPVNFEKFLRTSFFTEHLRWLLLEHLFKPPVNCCLVNFEFYVCCHWRWYLLFISQVPGNQCGLLINNLNIRYFTLVEILYTAFKFKSVKECLRVL